MKQAATDGGFFAMKTLRERFENPAREYRSMPFWGWNDELDPKEMASQIESMKSHGMGGFFMHSREGLETAYMGPEWMECVKICVQKAKEEGLSAWLYDEDRWPSGTAGGQVTAESEDFRAKGLTLEISQRSFYPEPSVQAVFKARIDGMNLLECERLRITETYPALCEEVYLIFRMETAAPSAWFNNESPPDNLNPATVQCFIQKTHEKYKSAVGQEFGKTIPGIFTDEPGLHDRNCHFTDYRGWLPWTRGFAEYFSEKRGYDILDTVPHIFFHGAFSSKARHDYWRTITERFSEAFTRQLYTWCERNGLSSTGHFLWEGNLGVATRVCGAVMPNYRYQHIPGIDLLNKQTDEYMTVKQCTSVANQYDKKRVISETYGCTGWDLEFMEQKWLGDFQFVMGVNIRCQHLALYSIRGCRKRDYPPFFGPNTTWWKYNGVIEDYFARLSAVLTEGKAVRDILVLHPSATAWCMMGTNPYGLKKRGDDRDIPAIKKYGDDFNLFLKYLMGCHNDFDLGDEIILKEAGMVRNGKLCINRTEYKIVIIPSVLTLLESTLSLLQAFMDEGGRVIAIKPLPTMTEGVQSPAVSSLFTHPKMTVLENWTDIKNILQTQYPGMVSIKDRFNEEIPSLYYMLRDTGDIFILFVVNNDIEGNYDAAITLESTGSVEEWMPLTGKTEIPDYQVINNGIRIKTRFGPAESRLFIIDKKKDVTPCISKHSEKKVEIDAISGTAYGFERTMPNALVLDKCQYQMNGKWFAWMDVWQAQRQIRDKLGMIQVYCNDVLPQRYTWIDKPHSGDGTPVSFRFVFEVRDIPVNGLELVVERSDWFKIMLNGKEQKNAPSGWFLDRAFHRILLEDIKKGKNVLTLSCDYRNRMEVEDCYIIGDFALDTNRRIIKEPAKLMPGDWNLQGYMHYAGSMVYHFEYAYEKTRWQEKEARMLLELGKYSAVHVEVRVNGKTAGHIPWKTASTVDITPFIKDGFNHIEIEVMGSPRNLFGPFHQAVKSNTVNSSSFRTEGKEYIGDYLVKPYGLFEPVRVFRSFDFSVPAC